ncbi:MAG: AAA family ATPase [Limisphaerales bacterium]
MKLRFAHIENFKGVKEVHMDFQPSPQKRITNLHALFGDNGSGKTTVLQAIALTLSKATRKTRRTEDFAWYGFLPERIGTLGRTRVELGVAFSEEEVRLNRELFDEWVRLQSAQWLQTHKIEEPGQFRDVTLVLESGELKAKEGFPALLQFLGRYYIKTSIRNAPHLREFFPKLGDVFWFDQYRNLGTAGFSQMSSEMSVGDKPDDKEQPSEPPSFLAGVETLREALVVMWGYQVRPPPGSHFTNYIPKLREKLTLMFPGTNFVGTAEMESATAPRVRSSYFLLERDGRVFDLAEMSSGEQAFFAVIYDFVRLGIQQSVVLIDELELHLHPPEQQAFLAALQKIGPDCQFIISTHSEFVEGSIGKDFKTRLPGGRLCL